jgi:hypothetical protein
MSPDVSILALARSIASEHGLDPALVCAVIEQESGWDTLAMRYEPAFRTRYVMPLGLPASEEIARSISWGLMQVMGQVAREHSFDGKFLTALCDPATGIRVGCEVLAAKLRAAELAAGGNTSATVAKKRTSQCTVACRSATLGCVTIAPEVTDSHEAGMAITGGLALWNGGANPNYPAQVLARISKYR